MINKKLISIIENLEEELIKLFHEFHRHPELSNEEFQTTEKIKKLLTDVEIEIIDLPLKTGVVAEVKGQPNGPVVAIRCDIDALPITEETHLKYRSANEGKMHACGHDFHIVVALGAAYLVKKYQPSLIGTVKFIFQPGEESADGAKQIIATGVLSDVDAIFGIHNVSDCELGVMGIKDGAMTASVDRFEINITGVGSHAARPEKAVDPIIITTNIINELQTIVSRNVSPADKALLSVTHIESGNTWNVIPDSAYIEGTVRTFHENTRSLISERMKAIIEGTAKLYGGTAELVWHSGSPATNNDKELTKFASKLGRIMGFDVREITMGLEGEDFAYYQKEIPGVFIVVGTGISQPHHHPEYTVDEKAIIKCSRYFAKLAECALKKIVDKNYSSIKK